MACFAIAKVLEGLDYAHRKRDAHGRPLEIVHRDCSPQNVLVSYEGEVKVIDFGIAKATSRNSRTMAGVLKGKFGYMSPEQVRGLPLDRRSDIFALGTMLYECLTGERLFMGETDFSTLEKVRNVDIAPPRSVNPAIPEAVEKVILKALAKDVDDRYQWCSEMLADLQQYLMGQDVVFTAKSLSSWLKEIFAQEIDRERAQLEQYKRVGRDGLIGGLPSAEADRDVVSHLGEAGAPEGDATTLGGPNFDDIEQAAGAAPEVGPPSRAQTQNDGTADLSTGEIEDFGEEAPTEIFGDDTQAPTLTPNGGGTLQPLTPIGRAPVSQPQMPMAASQSGRVAAQRAPTMQRAAEMAQMSPQNRPMPAMSNTPPPPPLPSQSGQQPMMYGQASPPTGVPQQYPTNPAYGYPQQPMQPGAMGSDPGGVANGTPGAFASQPSSKTVLGMQAPQQSGPYPYHPTGPMMAPQSPQHGNSQPYPAYPQYPNSPSMQQMPYGQQQGYGYAGGPATPHNEGAGVAEGKRSTLVRDIAIGVAIAAVVLGGFFIVKFVILDKSDAPATPPSTIATIKLSMTKGVRADLFVDDKEIGWVADGLEIPVSAGPRHVALVAANGVKCEEPVKLEAGKTTTLKCDMQPPAAGSDTGSAAAATGSDAGSAAAATTPAATTGSAAGSAAGVATPVPAVTNNEAKPPTPPPPTPPPPTNDATVAKPAPVTPTVPPTAKPTPKPEPAITKVETPKPAATPSDKGYLTITSKPSAKIAVDGVDTGMSTPINGRALSLAPGKHKITFIMGDDRYTFPVTISAGQTQAMSKDLE